MNEMNEHLVVSLIKESSKNRYSAEDGHLEVSKTSTYSINK